jgi:hypothetical protein
VPTDDGEHRQRSPESEAARNEGNAEPEAVEEREERAAFGAPLRIGEGLDSPQCRAEAGGPAYAEDDAEQGCAGEADAWDPMDPELATQARQQARERQSERDGEGTQDQLDATLVDQEQGAEAAEQGAFANENSAEPEDEQDAADQDTTSSTTTDLPGTAAPTVSTSKGARSRNHSRFSNNSQRSARLDGCRPEDAEVVRQLRRDVLDSEILDLAGEIRARQPSHVGQVAGNQGKTARGQKRDESSKSSDGCGHEERTISDRSNKTVDNAHRIITVRVLNLLRLLGGVGDRSGSELRGAGTAPTGNSRSVTGDLTCRDAEGPDGGASEPEVVRHLDARREQCRL